MSIRRTGRVTVWKDEKGFGFLTIRGSGESIFFHIRSFENRNSGYRPVLGEELTFEICEDEKGRSQAILIRSSVNVPTEKIDWKQVLCVPGIPFGIVILVILVRGYPLPLIPIYLFFSVIAYATYGLDKLRAQSNQWRISEAVLLLAGLLGGWPGALAGQKFHRHKIKKRSFMLQFWATVVVNLVGLIWMGESGVLESLFSLLDPYRFGFNIEFSKG